MRKLNFIIKGFLFFILANYPVAYLAQDFGRTPLQECWRLETEKITNFKLASDNASEIFLPLSNGSMEALDKNTGKTIWQTELGGEFVGSPILSGESIYTASKSNNPGDNSGTENGTKIVIRGLSLKTGITKWQRLLPSQEKVQLFCQPAVLYIFTESGYLYTLNKEDGQIISNLKMTAALVSFLYFDGTNIYYLTTNNKVISANSKTGQIISEFDNKYPTSAALVSKDILFSGDEFGNVQATRVNDKKVVWKSRTGAAISGLTVTPEGLLATSQDNYVYMFLMKNGKKVWKKRLLGRVSGEPIIKDGVAVLSVLGGSNAEYIDLKSGKQINQITVDEKGYFTGSPVLLDRLVVFPIATGLYAVGTKNDCRML